MSQAIPSTIVPGSTSGTQLANIINGFVLAVASDFKGPARPSNLQPGGMWIDDSQETGPNFKWYLKIYDGTGDITIFTINLASSAVSISGSDDIFQIAKISADASGPILKMIKERIASNGQVKVGDTVAELQFQSTDDTGANPIVARMRAIANDDATLLATGTYLSFETTTTGAAAITEAMRLIDGKLGIGVTAPTHTIHSKGNSGIRHERTSDDALGAALAISKARVTGNGSVQANDILGIHQFIAQDSTGAQTVTAQVQAKATQNHTAPLKGTELSLSVVKTGTNALVEKVIYGEQTTHKELNEFEALKYTAQSIATVATIVQLNADKTIVNFTGNIDTVVQGLNSGGVSKSVLIHNGSTGKITIMHSDAAAAAGDRFKLPKNKNIVLLPDTSLEVFYSTVDSRWKLKSGSGGGGGELAVLTPVSVADGGTIALSTVEARQLIKVAPSGTTGVLNVTPFGAFTGTDPVEVILLGDSDAPVFIPYNDAAYGAIGNFGADADGLEVSKNYPAKAVWYPTTQRFYVTRGV